MWLEYLKSAVRALLSDRFFSAVNLLGLSAGLAAVVAISLYVKNELSHDSWLPGHETLFRVDTVESGPGRPPTEIARAPGPLREALLSDFPQIEAVTRGYLAPVSVLRDGQPFNEEALVADPDFFTVTRLPFIAGSPERALATPSAVALSRRAAEKYFGDADVVGQPFVMRVPEPRDYVVAAVFETIPQNSHMAFDIVIPFDSYFQPSSDGSITIPDHWGGAFFHTYARLGDAAAAEAIERHFPAFIDRHVPQWLTEALQTEAHDFYQFRLVPVRDVHFEGAAKAAMKPAGNRTTVFALAGVAILILLIASINFANLTAARSELRAREVALRKVVGASRRQILVQFLVEALFLTMVAGLLALVLVELSLPYIGAWFGADAALPRPAEWQVWTGLVVLVLVTAFAAGLYPSLIVANIRPAQIFRRGRSEGGPAGIVRSALVVLQFAISIALIAVTLAMVMQTRFASDADLGFERDNIIVLRVPEGPERDRLARSLADAVLRHPEARSAALSSAVPGDPSEDNISVTVPGEGQSVQLGYHQVDPRFFDAYGVGLLAGRIAATGGPAPAAAPAAASGEAAPAVPAVVNQAALRRLGIDEPADAIGHVLRSSDTTFTVVGVVPDVHFRSLHEPVREEIYIVGENPGGVVSVRHDAADLPRFLAFLDRSWAERFPDRAVEREFLDDSLDALYERERDQTGLLGIFSGVAILLSCLGLFGMASFAIQRRTGEIAIRKVLGARASDILRLLLWHFSRPVVVANLIAWPIGYLIVSNWLSRFAYRIDMPYWIFAAAGLVAVLVACLAVGWHSLKVAREHPVKALREL